MLALSIVPLGLLALEWDGLVPPSADPASCGLCDDRQGLAREALTLRTVGFTVALAGAYGALVFGPSLVRRLRRLRSSLLARAYVGLTGRAAELRIRLLVAGAVGVLLLVISPLLYQPITPQQAGDAGYLWQLSDRFPELFGSSLLFWALVPLGCVVLYLLVMRAGIWSLPNYVYIMKILASRSDRENFLFLIGMIVIIIGILALLLAYVFFPIHSSEFTIGQTAISEILIWKYI